MKFNSNGDEIKTLDVDVAIYYTEVSLGHLERNRARIGHEGMNTELWES